MDTPQSMRAKLDAFRANPDPAIAALDFEISDDVMTRPPRLPDLGIQPGDKVVTNRSIYGRSYNIRVVPDPATLKSDQPWTFADLVT